MNADMNRPVIDGSAGQPAQDSLHGPAGLEMNTKGLITVRSSSSVPDTIAQIEATVAAAGLQVFARIDHAAGAAQVGMVLRPTVLLLFGHPRGGTPLMQEQQTVGLDLPLKVLAWEDAAGAVWLTYNDLAWLARRHRLEAGSGAAITALTAVMTTVTAVVARDEGATG